MLLAATGRSVYVVGKLPKVLIPLDRIETVEAFVDRAVITLIGGRTITVLGVHGVAMLEKIGEALSGEPLAYNELMRVDGANA